MLAERIHSAIESADNFQSDFFDQASNHASKVVVVLFHLFAFLSLLAFSLPIPYRIRTGCFHLPRNCFYACTMVYVRANFS